MNEEEYGSVEPIRFGNPKMYDSNRKEVEIPKCEVCGYHKCQVIGAQAFAWVCTKCGISLPQ